MFLTLGAGAISALPTLRRSMFGDRADQFVGRHRWALKTDPDGLEIDEFDDATANYCVTADGGRHLSSVRLRPARVSSLTERHFPSLWREELRGGMEITRFCASRSLGPDERLAAVSELLLGLCRHCQRSGVPDIFGIVFPPVARVIRQAGWPSTVLGELRDAEATLLLARWTASELVAWGIQERRELREELWSRRRATAVDQQRLVA